MVMMRVVRRRRIISSHRQDRDRQRREWRILRQKKTLGVCAITMDSSQKLRICMVIMWCSYFVNVHCGPCTIFNATSNLHTQHISSSGEVEVIFRNTGSATLEIIWLSEGGMENSMGLLEVNNEKSFSSYTGHAFRVRILSTSDTIFESVVSELSGSVLYSVGEGCSGESEGGSNNSFDAYKFSSSRTARLIDDPERVRSATLSSPCRDLGLNDWISKKVVVPGYHVLCLSPPLGSTGYEGSTWAVDVEAWRDGYDPVNQQARQTYTGSSMRDFRDHVEILLALPYVDALLQDTQVRIAARVKEKRLQKAGHSQAWRHLPAKWQLFDTDRREVRTMSDILPSAGRPRFVLVFEGGAFVYPGIDLGFTRTIAVSDGQLDLVTLSMRPLVISIDGFLRAAEYDQIVSSARPHMQQSPVSLMDKDKGREAAEFRTSQLLFMDSDRYSFLRAIDSRVANLTGQPTSHQEQVQVLKYEVGQYYLPHLDYWEPSFYQDPQVVQMTEAGHKNRLCTVFWYLSDCDGGYTAFPDAPIQQNGVSQVLYESDDEQARGRPYVTNTREVSQLEGTLTCPYGLRVPPHKGKAILFYSLLPNGQGDYMSSHSACAVTAGTKWAANKWVWNKRR